MCVSTGKAGMPKACTMTTDAVLWPTPGSASSASKDRGTSPAWRAQRSAAMACRCLALVGASPTWRISAKMSATANAAICAGVRALRKSAGVTSFTFLSVVCADKSTAHKSVNASSWSSGIGTSGTHWSSTSTIRRAFASSPLGPRAPPGPPCASP